MKTTTTQKEATQEIYYSQILKFGQRNCFWIWSYRIQKIGRLYCLSFNAFTKIFRPQ